MSQPRPFAQQALGHHAVPARAPLVALSESVTDYLDKPEETLVYSQQHELFFGFHGRHDAADEHGACTSTR